MSGFPTQEQLDERSKLIAGLWSNKDIEGIFEKYDDEVTYTDLGKQTSPFHWSSLNFLNSQYQASESTTSAKPPSASS
jgi:hypothetical protein